MGADVSFKAVKVGGRDFCPRSLNGVLSGTCRAGQFFGCFGLVIVPNIVLGQDQ